MKHAPWIVVAFIGLSTACSGGGSKAPDDSNGEPSPAVLRKNIGIDLAEVSSLVSLSANGGSRSLRIARDGQGQLPQDDQSSGQQLLALTLSGETLEVTLVEPEDPESGGPVDQPRVQGIYPIAGWILFATQPFSIYKADDPGGEPVDCQLVAARREDGALFCSPLGVSEPWDHRFSPVQSSAAGDVAYTLFTDKDPLSNGPPIPGFSIYRIALDAEAGPTATEVYSSIDYAYWFLSNAAGDLMVSHSDTLSIRETFQTDILPAGGGSPFTLQETSDLDAICGQAGAADENRFYVTGHPSDGTIVTVTPEGSSFVETPQQVWALDQNPEDKDPEDANDAYGGLYRLGNGIYMIGRNALVRVIADGAVVTGSAPIALEGVDEMVQDVNGDSIHPAAAQIVFLARTGTGYKFVRHDGTAQQDIVLDSTIRPSSYTVGSTGAIDFFAVRTDTQEKILGSIEAGATEAKINPADRVDPADVIVFTRIN